MIKVIIDLCVSKDISQLLESHDSNQSCLARCILIKVIICFKCLACVCLTSTTFLSITPNQGNL